MGGLNGGAGKPMWRIGPILLPRGTPLRMELTEENKLRRPGEIGFRGRMRY